jgi:hypothetical protein
MDWTEPWLENEVEVTRQNDALTGFEQRDENLDPVNFLYPKKYLNACHPWSYRRNLEERLYPAC